MPSADQIKGVLFEEVVLFLLRTSGYITISEPAGDPTLKLSASGLCVRGRGAEHQIDAIADFSVHQPFANPQRLLVEAKCHRPKNPIAIAVLRNAIGVLKDVSEFWAASTGGGASKPRYHYQYAVFATADFTREAQRYAFAHDIPLVPLARSAYFKPIISEIENTAAVLAGYEQGAVPPADSVYFDPRISLGDVRSTLRHLLQPIPETGFIMNEAIVRPLVVLLDMCAASMGGLLATVRGAFPLFLMPAPWLDLDRLRNNLHAQLFREGGSWFLASTRDNRPLFSFDVPAELFRRYVDDGALSGEPILSGDNEPSGGLQALAVTNRGLRRFNFHLEGDWISTMRRQIETISQPSELSEQ